MKGLSGYPRLHAVLMRCAQSIPVVVGVVVISFLLTRALPGDPAVYFAGVAADEASIEETRVAMGLDKPLVQQFFYLCRQSGSRCPGAINDQWQISGNRFTQPTPGITGTYLISTTTGLCYRNSFRCVGSHTSRDLG